MTTEAAQLQFAGEFTLFLVALALLAVVSLQPRLLTSRSAARAAHVVGAVALAASAFLSGSLLLDDPSDTILVSFRSLGIVAVAAGTLFWAARAPARVLFLVGLGILGAAEVVTAGDGGQVADALRAGGALVLGGGLLLASRRTIATRIATSSAAAVLAVILVVATALSFVIADSVEDEAVRRYGNRAQTEADLYADARGEAQELAGTVAQALGASEDAREVIFTLLVTDDQEAALDARSRIERSIARLRDALRSGDCGSSRQCPARPTVIASPELVSLAAIDAEGTTLLELVGSRSAAAAVQTRQTASQVSNVGGVVMAVGAAPITDDAGSAMFGVTVAAIRLDERFLRDRFSDAQAVDEDLGVVLADRDQILAAAGTQAVAPSLRLAREVLDRNERASAIEDDRLVVAVPLTDEFGVPLFAVVVSAPIAQVDATRQDLFQSLFIVALIAASAAMALSGVFGNRVGSTITSLTSATEEIAEGRFETRVPAETNDELGRLAGSVNAMAGSLATMTGDLRKAADDEARLRGRLEGVIGGMGEALVAVDDQGLITDFNAAAEELFGIPARDALARGLPAFTTVSDEDGLDITTRFVEPVVESFGQPAFVGEGDAAIPVVVSGAPLRGPGGQLTGAVFVVRDMRREAEIEAMKTNFIANVSHELRTPLTPIKGYSEILASRDMDPDKVKRFAGEIATGAGQMERIVNQLVQFATMAAGKLTLNREPVEPVDLIEAAVSRWQTKADPSHTISRRVTRDAPAAPVDRRYLDHVFDELIDNALKYSPDGGRVRLGARYAENGHGPHLLLTVEDQGVGIEPDRRHEIFDDFHQGDGSATRRFGGLGLGLSLVSRIVRAHGGELDCDSEPGKGTRVKVLLPVVPADADAPDSGDEGERVVKARLAAGFAAVAVVLALVVQACFVGGDGPGEAEGRLTVDGTAIVARADGETETVQDDATTIRYGDEVTVTAGTASLETGAGDRYALRAGIRGADHTRVSFDVVPSLLGGEIRVLDGTPAQLDVGGVLVSTSGGSRLSAGTGTVAAYRGAVRFAGGGPAVDLPALRQTTLADGAIVPLEYRGDDPWDREELGEAIAVGERLEAIARGYTSDLRVDPTPSFYETVLPGLDEEPEFQADLLAVAESPGELLVGAAIAVQGRQDPFRQRWAEIFAFRNQGARWGLVALDQGVSSAPLFDDIELAVERSPGIDAPRTTSTTQPPRTTTTIDRGGSTTTTTTTTTTPPPPPPDDGPVDAVIDLVVGIVQDTLGLDVGPDAAPSLTVPDTTVPPVTAPAVTVPGVTVPTATVP